MSLTTPIQGTLGTSVMVTTVGTAGIEWVGPKDVVQHSIVPRMPALPQVYQPQMSVSGANISVPALACCVFGNVMGELAKAHGNDGP